jgi:hypothetical protein
MSIEDEGYGEKFRIARDKANVPGILLLVVGVLNLLAAIWIVYYGMQIKNYSLEEFNKQLEKQLEQNPKQKKQFEDLQKQQGMTLEQLKDLTSNVMIGWGGVGLFTALLAIFGGWGLYSLRAYPVAFIGALVTAIPCISPAACCLLGEIAGLWALVALLNSDVSSMFGMMPPRPHDEWEAGA